MNIDLEALKAAARLEELGITVRSAELAEQAKQLNSFAANGGNRAMRRAAKKAGAGRTRKVGRAKVR